MFMLREYKSENYVNIQIQYIHNICGGSHENIKRREQSKPLRNYLFEQIVMFGCCLIRRSISDKTVCFLFIQTILLGAQYKVYKIFLRQALNISHGYVLDPCTDTDCCIYIIYYFVPKFFVAVPSNMYYFFFFYCACLYLTLHILFALTLGCT